jgi:hypothetical protein
MTYGDRQVVYNAGCTIGKPGSTGINDPREYHAPTSTSLEE